MKIQSMILVKANQLLAFFYLLNITSIFIGLWITGNQIIIGSFSISFSNMSIFQLSKVDYLPPFKPILNETIASR
ncbi:hypothetical protein LCGC14_1060100 [marine sediment metagenome]|uniref:Uncharacterized protein n=1 Tax=marine sediment metagenome TaxID=412755 RepID=A0A0F9N8B4_9ZZZZ